MKCSYGRIEVPLRSVRAVRWNRERLSEGGPHVGGVFLWWQGVDVIAVVHAAPSDQLRDHRVDQ